MAATTPYDDQLTCEHLRSERSVNDSRIADLEDERQNDGANNVGLVLGLGVAGALFVDTSRSEKDEAAALQARNGVLDGLIAQKCATTASTPP